MSNTQMPRRWPLLLVAPASCVAVWTGWVGLGEMTGFGPVRVLPGIADGLVLDTAITLPIGVEAYAAYALNAWLTPAPLSRQTRRFAKHSAIGSLVLGASGQAVYHLLAAAQQNTAPWPVTAFVSCLPVLVLGMAAALAHMLRADADNPEDSPRDSADREDSAAAEPVPQQGTPHRQPAMERTHTPSVTRYEPISAASADSHGDNLGDSTDKLTEARLVADRLASDDQPVSRAMLRAGGVAGSNQELSLLAKRLNVEREQADEQPATLAV